jgi:hypothetical protein
MLRFCLFLLRLGLHDGLAGIPDEMDGAPVTEGHGRSDDAAHADVHVRVGGAVVVGLLQLPVVAEERGDQDGDDDAHGQQDEQGGESGGGQADAVDDLLADLALEDGDAGHVPVSVGRVAVQGEGQVDGRDDFVADLDADIRTADVALVNGVRTLRSALDAFLLLPNFVLAQVVNVGDAKTKTKIFKNRPGKNSFFNNYSNLSKLRLRGPCGNLPGPRSEYLLSSDFVSSLSSGRSIGDGRATLSPWSWVWLPGMGIGTSTT